MFRFPYERAHEIKLVAPLWIFQIRSLVFTDKSKSGFVYIIICNHACYIVMCMFPWKRFNAVKITDGHVNKKLIILTLSEKVFLRKMFQAFYEKISWVRVIRVNNIRKFFTDKSWKGFVHILWRGIKIPLLPLYFRFR